MAKTRENAKISLVKISPIKVTTFREICGKV